MAVRVSVGYSLMAPSLDMHGGGGADVLLAGTGE